MSARRSVLSSFITACALGVYCSAAYAGQDAHLHTPSVSGMPQGVPFFCANPTVRTVGSGSWSSPDTWSTSKVPGATDKVAVGAGHTVTYDAASDATLECIEVGGTLSFKTDTSTRLKIVTIMVLQDGTLEIGSADRPVGPDARAEVVIADRPFDPVSDPSQVGHGIIALGNVRMHGAIKTTFLRVSREPLAGQTRLTFERPVTGWRAGDRVVLPDTRQLKSSEGGRSYQTQTEKIEIASVSGPTVTLAKPLAFDHQGARNAAGTLELLPHAGNLSRNVVIRSENPAGTRGHTMFISHADVDIRYAEFGELGRTKMGILNNTDFDSEGRVARIGTNQIGRYAVHFHHDFGPTGTAADRYQFALVGNAVDGSSKWGITIHRSHNGLIQDNVVFNTRGAGIVTEDGSESSNIFDHNFSLQTAGSRDAAPGNGYSTVLPNPGGDGSAFWFRGPNNVIRNNVAASAAESGFGLPVTALGNIRVPKFRGADTSLAAESTLLDTDHAAVPDFSNNEAYGAVQSGVVWAWSGRIAGLKVWHTSRHGVTATPSEKISIESLTARGDQSVLADVSQNPVGVWVANYAAKSVAVANADVQGFRIGVSSPFFYGQAADAKREGSLTIENSYFRTPVGVSVATSYSDADSGSSRKKAVVRNSTFEPLTAPTAGQAAAGAISMNVGMSPRDARPRDPILVYDFNKQPGRNFKVYYSLQAPDSVAPCHDTMPEIDGWVCQIE